MAGDPLGFRIERATNAAFTTGFNSTQVATPDLEAYTASLPAPNTVYFLRVRAYNAAGASAPSNTVQVTSAVAAGAPAAPSNMDATVLSDTSAGLTWTDNATDEQGVDIQQATNATFTTGLSTIRVAGANQTSATMGGTPGVRYWFRVRAYNAAGVSAYSGSDNVTLTGVVPPPTTSRTYGEGLYGDLIYGYGGVPPVIVPGGEWTPTVREKPPLRLSWESVSPNGKRHRWAADEPDPANVPSGGRHSSTMPGGFETADCTLPRKPGVDYSDLERLSTLVIRGAGGDVAGEYRLERAPKSSGDKMAITPSAVGWQAHLEDDKSVRVIYVDIDLSRWRGMSDSRQLELRNGGWIPFDGNQRSQDKDADPALALEIAGMWTDEKRPVAEIWYDAGAGAKLSAVAFIPDWEGFVNTADPLWSLAGFSADKDGLGPYDTSNDYFPSEQAQFYTFPAHRFVALQWRYDAQTWPGGAEGLTFAANMEKVAVYGNHGLPGRTPPQGGNPGFNASDVIAHAVRTSAPLLSVKSVQQTRFVIEQLAFPEPTTGAEIIRQANRFHLWDWGVFENREFFYHQRGAKGRRWRARVSPAQLEETGPQVDRVWESVIVAYRDVDGSTRTVGPPGSSSDFESELLKDRDPANPANAVGATRRDVLSMGTATAASATEVGARFLEQSKLLDSSGRANFVGHVEDDRGVLHPYWRVRAGDQVSFVDSNDKSYRRIVKADCNHQARTCSVDLDAPPEGFDALLERLGVTLIPLGVNL